MEEDKFLKPLSDEVIILDDPDYTMENGVIVPTSVWRTNLDYWVVKGGTDEFGIGDRVILDDPMAGRKIKLDRVCYRVVRKDSIIGVVETAK
jgi:co-chaperonin GroES (HSP10)